MTWVFVLIAVIVVYEAILLNIYLWIHKHAAQYLMWVALGTKILKIFLAITAILVVYKFTDINILDFSLCLAVLYMLALIIETAIFVKKS